MSSKESKKNKSVVFAAICFVLVFAIVLLAVVSRSKQKETQNNSSLASSSQAAPSSENLQSSHETDSEQSNLNSNSSTDAFLSNSSASSQGSSFTVSHPVSADDWQLLLANATHRIENYVPEVKEIPSSYCQDNSGYYFDARACDDLMDMIYAAGEDGVDLLVLSSYRTYSFQTTLYNNKVAYYKNLGYEQAEAESAAATVVAVPGTSDHNLGLACDFNYLEQEYEDTEELTWLRDHAEKYGFVCRYPKDKEEVTGIIYEPWHYRYVGKENAKAMNGLHMCLEEYVEYIENLS